MPQDEVDDLHITKQQCGPRNVKVSSKCPPGLQRSGLWRVEDFDLHKRLYQGKASLLFSAACKRSKLPVAVKVYRKAKLSELNWYQVEREIRIHSRLDHANIIQLYAAFEDDMNVYMVQEFATGGDLYEDLKQRGGRFEEGHAAAGVLQPCISALIYLHSKGIIHRDIKPENILLMADKSIKLADFGLSIDATSERPVTRAGTLDYMAPEVLLCPEKSRPQENKDKVLLGYTAMVDAWAMGILAYELIVGRPPFEKQSRAATYEHIMYRKPEFPATMSPDAKDFVFTALTKAARKRPALANMLSHPWLLASGPQPSPPQPALSPTPILTRGPTPPGVNPADTGPQTPLPVEGRQHQGMSPCTTTSEEMVISCEMLGNPASPSDSRAAAVSSLMAPVGVHGQPGVKPQRSFQERAQTPPLATGSLGPISHKGTDDSEDSEKSSTWTATLKRGMMKMLSKGSSSGKHSPATDEAASAAVAASAVVAATSGSQKPSVSGRSSGDALSTSTSPPGGRSMTPAGSSNMGSRVWELSGSQKQGMPSKGSSQRPSSAMLSPIASQSQSQSNSAESSVRAGKSARILAVSPFGSDAAQTRSMKASLDLSSSLGQGRPGMIVASAASLPTSGLKVNMQTNRSAAARMETHHEASADLTPRPEGPCPLHPRISPRGSVLVSQPSQPVQTVQEMLLAMQQEHSACESSGGRLSPKTMSLGLTDSVSSTTEPRARAVPGGPVRDSAGGRNLESPFAESLLSKSYANNISRRYAMVGMQGSGGSNSNFTDYAAAQRGPSDMLRGATSFPIHANNRNAYIGLSSSDQQETDAAQVQQSTQDERTMQLMQRSQSLALPGSLPLEANGRSATNRGSYRRADLVTRSQRHISKASDDGNVSGMLRTQLQHHQQQQKGDKGLPRRRITNQNIEPAKAKSTLKEGGFPLDSPRVGGGLIKVGLAPGSEDNGRTGC